MVKNKLILVGILTIGLIGISSSTTVTAKPLSAPQIIDKQKKNKVVLTEKLEQYITMARLAKDTNDVADYKKQLDEMNKVIIDAAAAGVDTVTVATAEEVLAEALHTQEAAKPLSSSQIIDNQKKNKAALAEKLEQYITMARLAKDTNDVTDYKKQLDEMNRAILDAVDAGVDKKTVTRAEEALAKAVSTIEINKVDLVQKLEDGIKILKDILATNLDDAIMCNGDIYEEVSNYFKQVKEAGLLDKDKLDDADGELIKYHNKMHSIMDRDNVITPERKLNLAMELADSLRKSKEIKASEKRASAEELAKLLTEIKGKVDQSKYDMCANSLNVYNDALAKEGAPVIKVPVAPVTSTKTDVKPKTAVNATANTITKSDAKVEAKKVAKLVNTGGVITSKGLIAIGAIISLVGASMMIRFRK